jgi:hypothetical protein
MREVIPVLAAVLVVALWASIGIGIASGQSADQTVEDVPETGDAILGDQTDPRDLETTDEGDPILSGLDDPDLDLVGVEYVDGNVVLEIDASTSKSIQVLDALASGGEATTILRPSTRSLSEGRNEVVLEDVGVINGVAVVNLNGGGDTAQIPVRASGGASIPETTDVLAWAGGILSVVLVGAVLAYRKKLFAGIEKDRDI